VELTAEQRRGDVRRRPTLASLRHQARIVVVSASSEFKLKYSGSVLGYLWSILKPLGLFGMLYVVFGRFFKLGAGVPHYPVYLLLGIVLWTYFSDTTLLGMKSIVERSELISRLAFPRVLVPVSVSVSSAITFGVNLVAFAVLLGLNGIVPRPNWLLLLPLVLELYVVALGIALILTTLYVRFRDVGQVWELVLQLLFYASPIIYPASRLPGWFQQVTFLNPFVQISQDARAIVISSGMPTTAPDVYGTPFGELLPIAVGLVLLVGGYLLFRREEPWFAERA
jgi:ABC-2 type transport system permease protein